MTRRWLPIVGTRRLALQIVAAWILWDTTGGIPQPQGSYLTKWGCEWDVRTKLNTAYAKAKSQEGTSETKDGTTYSYGEVTRSDDGIRQKFSWFGPSSSSLRFNLGNSVVFTAFACYPESFDPRAPQQR